MKFKELKESEQKEIINKYFKMLIVAYNQDNIDNNQYEKMAKMAHYELNKIQHLTTNHIQDAYYEVLINYTKYRRFTLSGFMSSIYEMIS